VFLIDALNFVSLYRTVSAVAVPYRIPTLLVLFLLAERNYVVVCFMAHRFGCSRVED
jgi:hypothetical protein